jgi:hypothetical protein
MDDPSFYLCTADAPRTPRTLPVLSLYLPCTHNSYTAAAAVAAFISRYSEHPRDLPRRHPERCGCVRG